MNKVLIFSALAFALFSMSIINSFAEEKEEDLIDVLMHYSNGKVTINSIQTRKAIVPDYLNQPETGYKAILFDEKDRPIFSLIFKFPTDVVYQNPEDEHATAESAILPKLDDMDYHITLPYPKNAKSLEIRDSQETILVKSELNNKTVIEVVNSLGEVKEDKNVFQKIFDWIKNIISQIISGITSIFSSGKSTSQLDSASPSPAPISPDLQKILNLIPLTNEYMTVLFFQLNGTISVTIEKAPFDENRKLALEWFKQQGVEDLCSLNLEFSASVNVKPRGSLTAEERSTPGCELLPQT